MIEKRTYGKIFIAFLMFTAVMVFIAVPQDVRAKSAKADTAKTSKKYTLDLSVQSEGNTHAAWTGEGTVTLKDVSQEGAEEGADITAEDGDTVNVTVTPADGYYLAQVRLCDAESGEDTWTVLSPSDDKYSFKKPSGDVTAYADFISIEWDGTIDLTWYDKNKTSFDLKYPAQFEGAAALVNGLFNDYPVEPSRDGDGDTIYVPSTDGKDLPAGHSDALYTCYPDPASEGFKGFYAGLGYDADTVADIQKSMDSDGYDTSIVGDISLLTAKSEKSTTGGNNQQTTRTVWVGSEEFTGKTLNCMSDMDMGGTYTGNKFDKANWTGPNFMSVSGQFCMDKKNGYTRLGTSFNGIFDGRGHMVSGIFIDRNVRSDDDDGTGSANFGDCQAVGLFGRLGSLTDTGYPVVENIAVDGYISGNRSVGGIVGKIGTVKKATIQSCLNFASIRGTDAKGCAGIIGAAWNSVLVKDCVNFGYIYSLYDKNISGIAGSNEKYVQNCYNMGYVCSKTKFTKAAQAIGTSQGGNWFNCYWLSNSSPSWNAEGYEAVYNIGAYDTVTEITSPDTFKTAGFYSQINAHTRDWVLAGSNEDLVVESEALIRALHNIYYHGDDDKVTNEDITGENCPLALYDGYINDSSATSIAVPRVFCGEDKASVTKIEANSGSPETEYISGQAFDPESWEVWAYYDDGSKEEIEDYTIDYAVGDDTAFDVNWPDGSPEAQTDSYTTVEEQTVIITATRSGKSGTVSEDFSFEVNVTPNQIDDSDSEKDGFTIASAPVNTYYAQGEKFSTYGMTMRAYYTNGTMPLVTDYIYEPDGALTTSDDQITVTYRYNGMTKTRTIDIDVVDSVPPSSVKASDGLTYYEVKTADDLKWVGNKVTKGVPFDEDGNDWKWNIILKDDIQIGTSDVPARWTSISTAYNGDIWPYTGVFDGNGHTITANIDMSDNNSSTADPPAALFAYVSDAEDYGIIKDLKVAGSLTGGAGTSGITGIQDGGGITGCRCSADITVADGYYIGGIAGALKTGGKISSCEYSGEMNIKETTKIGYAGGIAGVVARPGSFAETNTTDSSKGDRITDCVNSGTINGWNHVGGIAGLMDSEDGIISGCENKGEVHANIDSYSRTYSCGGIIGTFAEGSVSKTCNKAEVSSCYASTGGIAGYAKNGNDTPEVANCYNTGDVTVYDYVPGEGTEAGDDYTYAGGIVGYMAPKIDNGSEYNCVTVKNCYSAGKISAVWAGGLFGLAGNYDNITNDYALDADPDSDTEKLAGKVSDDSGEIDAKLLTSDELKAAAELLGDAYVKSPYSRYNGGYPVFADQIPTAEDEKYIAALISTDIAALGEEPDVEMVSELYKDYSALGRDAKAEVLGAGIFDTLDKNLKYGSLKAESVAYTGKEATPSVTVTSLTGKTLTKDKDYTASCSENINVGKEAIVTVTGKGGYSGSISGTFEITKGTNTLSGTGTYTKTGKAGSAQSFKLNAAAVFGGTITYGSNSSYVTVKAGTVTIKKNFTGIAKLTLKSVSSGNYNAASKTITVNVKPGKMAVKSAKNVKSKKLKITWMKMAGADKYQVRVAYNSKMTKGRKSYTVKNSVSTKTTGKLRKGKAYYVQIRVYDFQTKAWSAWSAKKKCKVRK